MKTRKAFAWALCATLAALLSLASPLYTAAQVDPSTGGSGAALHSAGSEQEEPPGFADTGVQPDGGPAAESAPQAEAEPQVEAQQVGVQRSGLLFGQVAEEDRPADPTPAATGVGQ